MHMDADHSAGCRCMDPSHLTRFRLLLTLSCLAPNAIPAIEFEGCWSSPAMYQLSCCLQVGERKRQTERACVYVCFPSKHLHLLPYGIASADTANIALLIPCLCSLYGMHGTSIIHVSCCDAPAVALSNAKRHSHFCSKSHSAMGLLLYGLKPIAAKCKCIVQDGFAAGQSWKTGCTSVCIRQTNQHQHAGDLSQGLLTDCCAWVQA